MTSSAQLWELSVAQIASGLRRRSFSPAELVQALLDRSDAVGPSIQAWQLVDAERASAQAAVCERQLRTDGPTYLPLLGVPFGVKDIISTAGLRTECGAPALPDLAPREDATVVARLKAAGAMVLGKTVTTQFAFVDPVQTRNPWNLSRSPGFSSSGSVAAVAARMVPAALGTQTGGSTVRPSAYCGVVGLKPTFGRIGRRGVMPLSWSLDDVGLIARDVDGVALLLGAAAGPHRDDPTASRRAVRDYVGDARHVDSHPPRIGVLTDCVRTTAPVVQDHIEGVVRQLAAAGAHVRDIPRSIDSATLFALQQVTLASEAAAAHSQLLADHPDAYQPKLRAFIQVGQLIPASVYIAAQRLRRRARESLGQLFRGVDCLLLPAQPDVAPAFGTDVAAVLQGPWTLLGVPAMSLPSGLSRDSLPLGVQLVGRHFREDQLLRVARWCERVLGKLPAPPTSSEVS